MSTEKKSKLEERIEQLREVKERARQGGGAKKWGKQKNIGKQLTARESRLSLNFGTDWIYMWPMAELGVLGAEQSVKLF